MNKCYRLIVPGSLINLNEYIRLCRSNKYVGANAKKNAELYVYAYIKQQLKDVRITKQVYLNYLFVEKDKRRDLDNIASFAMKVIQDALVQAGVLQNDGWKEIKGFDFKFEVSKQNPHIELNVQEA